MAYTWNDGAGRFVNERGQFVRESTVRAVVDQVADHASARLAAASERLLAGEISLGAWQLEAMQITKTAMVSGGVLAKGGAAQMSSADYGRIGRMVRDQYAYLRSFAEQIQSGAQPLDGTLRARAEMYGQQSRVAYETIRGRDQAARGYRSVKNVLHAQESCSGCRAQSRRGWVQIGTLVPVGQRTCLSRCKCTVSYRREAADEVAA